MNLSYKKKHGCQLKKLFLMLRPTTNSTCLNNVASGLEVPLPAGAVVMQLSK